MSNRPLILTLAAILAPLGCVSIAQPPAAQGFDAYGIFATRNIFDPDRRPHTVMAVEPTRVAEPPPRAVDFVTLTGVMVNNGKALAFFSGSRSDYDKVTEVNGDIAGAKVAKITPSGIQVVRSGRTISVPVGQTVPFDNSAPGAPPASAGDTALDSAPPPAAAAAGDAAATPAPLPGNLNEVMRRMMERRQQELQ